MSTTSKVQLTCWKHRENDLTSLYSRCWWIESRSRCGFAKNLNRVIEIVSTELINDSHFAFEVLRKGFPRDGFIALLNKVGARAARIGLDDNRCDRHHQDDTGCDRGDQS